MLKLRVAGELRRIARLEVCDNIFVGFSKCKGTSAMLRHLKYTKAVRPQACCGVVSNGCCNVSAPSGTVFEMSAAPLPPPKPAIACTS